MKLPKEVVKAIDERISFLQKNIMFYEIHVETFNAHDTEQYEKLKNEMSILKTFLLEHDND